MKPIYLAILTFIICVSCRDPAKKKDTSTSVRHHVIDEKKEWTGNKFWISTFNSKSNELSNLYSDEAVKIDLNGEVKTGSTEIINELFLMPSKVKAISSDTLILARKERGIEYEVVEREYHNGEIYKVLLIWQTIEQQRKIVLEFSHKIEKERADLEEINQRRRLWISLCNLNKARDLIYEMYSENTFYYNHKPLVKGWEDLVGEYQYMSNEKYELFLLPEYIEAINENVIFEIGQCKGSYSGKYILIWKKDEEGKWRIFMDSNI